MYVNINVMDFENDIRIESVNKNKIAFCIHIHVQNQIKIRFNVKYISNGASIMC